MIFWVPKLLMILATCGKSTSGNGFLSTVWWNTSLTAFFHRGHMSARYHADKWYMIKDTWMIYWWFIADLLWFIDTKLTNRFFSKVEDWSAWRMAKDWMKSVMGNKGAFNTPLLLAHIINMEICMNRCINCIKSYKIIIRIHTYFDAPLPHEQVYLYTRK